MKKILSFVILLLMVSAVVYSQHKPLKPVSAAKDNSYVTDNQGNLQYVYAPTIHNPYAPAGSVPFPLNYNDYGTNGNNMRKLVVLGDTIIVGQDINPDNSGPPPVTTTTRIYYQVSYNAGATWLSNAINTSPTTANRWANIIPIYNSGFRSVVFMGRQYSTVQVGLAMVETILGLGTISSYITDALHWRDYFGGYKNSTTVGGLITSPNNSTATTDTLWYRDLIMLQVHLELIVELM